MTEYIVLRGNAKDITKQRFGRLIVLGPVGRAKDGHILWLCQCDCGEQAVVSVGDLRSGHTKSCGCRRMELVREMSAANITHGLASDRMYGKWKDMKRRCHNPEHRNYPDYGGRGIAVCAEWRDDFKAFYDHVTALPGYGKPGMSLDRIDNDGNYEPGNVRWATEKQQKRNTRYTVMLEFDGKIQCMADWADELGMKRVTLEQRIRSGWSVERALTESIRGEVEL